MGRSLRVDLLEWAAPFDRWCARLGKKPSVVLRELVIDAIGATPGAGGAPAAVLAPEAPSPRAARPQRVVRYVGLGETEMASLKRQAIAAGLPMTGYLATVLAAVESGSTSIAGKDAVEALAQSNYQLAGIGRTLRAIGRRQVSGCAPPAPEDAQGLSESIALLRVHLARAACVLADVEATRCIRRKTSFACARSRPARL